MTRRDFPWYEVVEDVDDLEQGDIIPNCRCFLPVADENDISSIEFQWKDRDLIVLSQSCDLVRGREKINEVLMATIWTRTEVKGHLQTSKGLEDARRGILPSIHLLADFELAGAASGIRLVDFRSLHTLPLGFLRSQAVSNPKRLRLLPPYREHLSQAFARFFMRVGLPVDIPSFT